MEVRNCRNCKRLFNYLQGPIICPACQEEMEKKFSDVKNYVWDHKDASIEEISEENDVPIKQIQQWIREERLTFSENSISGIPCENCGKMIKSGRFCDDCKGNMMNALDSVKKKETKIAPQKKERDRDRMRFLDK
ncbi:MAG: flagellar protein [Lachnospiraceae bacterium]|nr:flagellar protein [Lachnospiraceae bacterium]